MIDKALSIRVRRNIPKPAFKVLSYDVNVPCLDISRMSHDSLPLVDILNLLTGLQNRISYANCRNRMVNGMRPKRGLVEQSDWWQLDMWFSRSYVCMVSGQIRVVSQWILWKSLFSMGAHQPSGSLVGLSMSLLDHFSEGR